VRGNAIHLLYVEGREYTVRETDWVSQYVKPPSKSIRTATKVVRTMSFVNLNNLSWTERMVGKGNIVYFINIKMIIKNFYSTPRKVTMPSEPQKRPWK
jgi:hypothetical protein